MIRRTKLAMVAGVAATGLLLAACSSDKTSTSSDASTKDVSTTMMTSAPAKMSLVEIAASNPDFSTLVTAVKAAGLVGTLSGTGPFTVFAPTNEAFAKLPAGTLDTLLKPENKQTLTNILTYHVVAGEVLAKDVKPGKVKTVNGAELTISVEGGKVFITDGKGQKIEVVKTDIQGSNGVIHVINGVLLPA
ncbi:MAG: fasciclin domain-containing protein [Acidimicrobiia bacterium]